MLRGSRARALLRLPGFALYVTSVCFAGLVVLAVQLGRLHWSGLGDAGAAFWTVALLLVLAELRPVVTAGSPDETGVTISTAFVFALLLHWGLPVAVLMQTVATLVADLLRRRTAWRTAFNIAQYTLAWTAAALVLSLTGKLAGLGDPLRYSSADLPGTLLAAAVYFFCNDALVSTALSLHDKVPMRDLYHGKLGYRVFTESALLALAPIVVVVLERGAALVPLLILPIAAVYATASVSLQREHQAHHDALTGLPNRKLLLSRAEQAVAAAVREGSQAALFLVDLDRFKEVNDTLGHATGDALLRLAATRLAGALRPGDTVARLGGDEFAILLPAVRGIPAAREVAVRVHRALAAPYHHESSTFELEGSLGIAVCPEHATDVATLLQRADVAMYLAKETGSGVEVYSADRDRHSAARLGLFGELRRALDAGQLSVHYQPEMSVATGEIAGVEALLRWEHPDQGLLAPESFLDLAESSGLMRQITRYVVDLALEQAAVWVRAGLATPVAVNVSARDLYDPAFVDDVAAALQARRLPGSMLTVEVTESLLMADPSRAAGTLAGLAELGVRVSLDDFGTGYSSLVHLRRLPVGEIKVDRSFVSRMTTSEDDAVIVRSIVDLGAALGLRVVAEGVDSAAVWGRVVALGCPVVQGYFVSRAMPGPEVTDRLRARGAAVIVDGRGGSSFGPAAGEPAGQAGRRAGKGVDARP
jgi:diguanylate cyclase (GGDEF)-like protein